MYGRTKKGAVVYLCTKGLKVITLQTQVFVREQGNWPEFHKGASVRLVRDAYTGFQKLYGTMTPEMTTPRDWMDRHRTVYARAARTTKDLHDGSYGAFCGLRAECKEFALWGSSQLIGDIEETGKKAWSRANILLVLRLDMERQILHVTAAKDGRKQMLTCEPDLSLPLSMPDEISSAVFQYAERIGYAQGTKHGVLQRVYREPWEKIQKILKNKPANPVEGLRTFAEQDLLAKAAWLETGPQATLESTLHTAVPSKSSAPAFRTSAFGMTKGLHLWDKRTNSEEVLYFYYSTTSKTPENYRVRMPGLLFCEERTELHSCLSPEMAIVRLVSDTAAQKRFGRFCTLAAIQRMARQCLAALPEDMETWSENKPAVLAAVLAMRQMVQQEFAPLEEPILDFAQDIPHGGGKLQLTGADILAALDAKFPELADYEPATTSPFYADAVYKAGEDGAWKEAKTGDLLRLVREHLPVEQECGQGIRELAQFISRLLVVGKGLIFMPYDRPGILENGILGLGPDGLEIQLESCEIVPWKDVEAENGMVFANEDEADMWLRANCGRQILSRELLSERRWFQHTGVWEKADVLGGKDGDEVWHELRIKSIPANWTYVLTVLPSGEIAVVCAPAQKEDPEEDRKRLYQAASTGAGGFDIVAVL